MNPNEHLPSAAAVEQVANFQRIEIAARLLRADAKLHMDVSATLRRIVCQRALTWADTLIAVATETSLLEENARLREQLASLGQLACEKIGEAYRDGKVDAETKEQRP